MKSEPANIVLVTGGARSGKSAYALRLGEQGPAPRVFVATCPLIDDELRRRALRHREERKRGGWDTIEETLDLAGALRGAEDCATALVDCLTLWVSNLMYEAERAGETISEDHAARLGEELVTVCAGRSGTTIFVTNEVGLGVCPDNAQARLYRDLMGRLNQVMAAGADVVTFLACGIPTHLKGG